MRHKKFKRTPAAYLGAAYGFPPIMGTEGLPFGFPVMPNTVPPETYSTGPAVEDAPVLHLDLPKSQDYRDILIVEFDRALFHTPSPNLDLLEPTSARLVETGLADEGWWVSPTVLETAHRHCSNWNEALVDILKLAIDSPEVFTAVISGRTEKNEDQIRKMLTEKGIGNIDCLVLGDARQQIRVRKLELTSKLWSHFYMCNRLTIYEGRPKDAKGLRSLLATLATEARNGLILKEVMAPLVLFPPLVERELLDEAVYRYNQTAHKPIVAEISRNGCVYRLLSNTRQEILQNIQEPIQPDQIIMNSAKSSNSSTEENVNSMLEWSLIDAVIEGSILKLNMSRQDENVQFLVCGRLSTPDGSVNWFDSIPAFQTMRTVDRRLYLRT